MDTATKLLLVAGVGGALFLGYKLVTKPPAPSAAVQPPQANISPTGGVAAPTSKVSDWGQLGAGIGAGAGAIAEIYNKIWG